MTEETMFAPSGRAPGEVIARQNRAISSIELVREMLDAQPSLAGIINRERQFVFANDLLLETLGMTGIEEVLGKRPGEALLCVHSCETEGGCGTAESCRYCGAVQAVLESQATGERVSRECRITCSSGSGEVPLDLRVTASPCYMNGEEYLVLAITDIEIEKRKAALERAFFHDLIGAATTLNLTMDLVDEGAARVEEEWPAMRRMTRSILEDAFAQRDLAAAERGELVVRRETLDAGLLLEGVVDQLKAVMNVEGKAIVIGGGTHCSVSSDERLLSRALFNMLKNALEAEPEGHTVQASWEPTSRGVRFMVHNDAVMPREVRLSVFQRSYSTKGYGRGLGTYSMKLLVERYLGGTVWFESSDGAGTTFYIELPFE